MTKNVKLFEDILKTPEPEVRLFSEVMRTPVPPRARRRPRDVAGLPEQERIKTPHLTKQASGAILIEHGWDDKDYVWHFEPAPRRQWKASLDRVIYAAARTLNEVVPSSVHVKIWKPFLDWEVKVVTFKALEIGSCWNVAKRDVEQAAGKLFEVLNTLV